MRKGLHNDSDRDTNIHQSSTHGIDSDVSLTKRDDLFFLLCLSAYILNEKDRANLAHPVSVLPISLFQVDQLM